MIKFKNLLGEEGGAGDWGTDKARKKLQQDTPGQGITDIGAKNKERNESYYDKSKYRFKKRELDHELGHETKGNQGIYIDGKLWKVVGKEATAKKIVDTLHKKGKNATYMHTNKPVSESVELDELDSKTYRSYIDKATADQLKRIDKKKQTDKDKQTMKRRSLGISIAQMKQYGDKRSVSQRIRGEEMEIEEATDFRAGDTVYQVGSKLKGTVLHKGNQDKIVVKFGSINKMIPASQLRLAEEVEIDEGTLPAKDSNVIDTILDALRVKLLSDLEKGNVKDAQEVAKLVKMTIEKDYKHKGYSRLKR